MSEDTVQTQLQQIETLLLPKRRFGNTFQSTEIIDNTLAVHCQVQNKAPLAFEITAATEYIQLVVSTDDETTLPIMQQSLQAITQDIKDTPNARFINAWPANEDPQTLTGDILVLMQMALLLMEFGLHKFGSQA